MPEREAFLLTLDDCEKTNTALLLALDSGTPETAILMARREEQFQRLRAVLPAELRPGDLERLKLLFSAGQAARLKALAAKDSAAKNLISIRRDAQVARQLAAVRDPRQPGIDCTG